MAIPGFCGPSYQSQSLNADAQLLQNWILESVESGMGKGPFLLADRPGQKLLFTLVKGSPAGGVRGIYLINGRVFAVCDTFLFEITFVGGVAAANNLGSVVNDGKRAYMSADPTQLAVASGGHVYVLTLASNAFAEVTIFPVNGITISQIGFSDGFFMALRDSSQQIYVSNPEDSSTWDLTQTAAVSVFPDNVLRILMDHREPWIFGKTKIQPYFDSGAVFPFDVVPGGYIETGIAAPESAVQLDNGIFWIGSDERGHGIAWRANGYTPTRVSNHALESAWQQYETIRDAIGYSCQYYGHSLWVIYFPTANVTWVYDVATNQWSKWSFRLSGSGVDIAQRSQCHVFVEEWNAHIVGDWQTGNLYRQEIVQSSGSSWVFADDFGNPIIRTRIAPPITSEMQWDFHHILQIDVEVGRGPIPPLTQAAPFPNVAAVLQDSHGVFWNLSVLDNGGIQAIGGQAGPAQGLTLNDQSLAGTSWQFGITPGGMVTLTKVAFSSAFSASLQLATSQTALFTVLSISNGQVQLSAPTAFPRDPQMMISWSDDNGNTWSNERIINCGQAGNYKVRAITRRLGRTRNRLYKISASDPIPWRVVNAYLENTNSQPVRKRLPHELAARA